MCGRLKYCEPVSSDASRFLFERRCFLDRLVVVLPGEYIGSWMLGVSGWKILCAKEAWIVQEIIIDG